LQINRDGKYFSYAASVILNSTVHFLFTYCALNLTAKKLITMYNWRKTNIYIIAFYYRIFSKNSMKPLYITLMFSGIICFLEVCNFLSSCSTTQEIPSNLRSPEVHPPPLLGWSGTESTTALLYQPRIMDCDECEEIGGMLGRESRSTRRKPVTIPLCPPQIPHDLNRD
jgi:hypothetical protein